MNQEDVEFQNRFMSKYSRLFEDLGLEKKDF